MSYTTKKSELIASAASLASTGIKGYKKMRPNSNGMLVTRVKFRITTVLATTAPVVKLVRGWVTGTASDVLETVTLPINASSGSTGVVGMEFELQVDPPVELVAERGLVRDWTASTAYVVGDLVRGLASATGHLFRCITAGTSHSAEPTWATALGGTNAEGGGTCVWQYIGVDKSVLAIDCTTAAASGAVDIIFEGSDIPQAQRASATP